MFPVVRRANIAVRCATVALLFLGCPERTGLETLPALTTDDAAAEAALRQADEAAEASDLSLARARYEAFLRDFPSDPLTPLAELGLGRIDLAEGHAESARARFRNVAQHPDPSVAERGRFYDGIAAHILGEPRYAIHTLSPYVGRTIDPEETALLLNTLAAASLRVGDRLAAMRALDVLTQAAVADEERAQARTQLFAMIADEATRSDIDHYYDGLARTGTAWAEVARRAIRHAYDAGDLDRVRSILEDLESQGIELDAELSELALRVERTEHADPNVIGAILPLTGRARRVGQSILQGLALASGTPGTAPPAPGSPQLVFRDDGSDPERAVRAVDDLVSVHRVIAIIGPVDTASSLAAGRRAQELGVPLIALTPSQQVAERGRMVFRLFTSPVGETRELVQAARDRGATRFAILHPENAFGNALRQAYETQVRAHGGTVASVVSYPQGASTFGPEIARLASEPFDALFIADSSRALSLIAPALAAAGLWSTPAGSTPTAEDSRAVLLLAPSVAYDDDLVVQSGRYLQGALFARPFHPGSTSGEARAFIDAYQVRYNEEPDVYAAYAYDAFRIVRRRVDAGATSREDLANALLAVDPAPTVTASDGFDATRGPRRSTQVWELRGSTLVL